MISENKKKDNQRTFRGLENDVPQNRGLDQGDPAAESAEKPNDDLEKPVDNGGVETTKLDPQLEEQWLAVRDEYLSHYPELEDTDTEYEEGSFYTIIESLAKKRKRTPKEIQNEIMDWSR